MNKYWKDKWIKALRSGEYAQGTGQLKCTYYTESGDKVEYCCLGVLCDIAKTKDQGWDDNDTFIFGDYEVSVNTLTDNALIRFGIERQQQDMLIAINDLQQDFFEDREMAMPENNSFEAIAVYIENYL